MEPFLNLLASIGRGLLGACRTAGNVALFALEALSHVVRPPFYGRLFLKSFLEIAYFSLPVVAWHVWSALRPWRRRMPSRWMVPLETGIYAAALLLVLTNSGSAGDFIYFQF